MRNLTKTLVPTLSMLALLTACGGGGGGGGAAGESMKYIPANSTFLLVVDVKKAVASPLMQIDEVKKMVEGLKSDGDYKEMTAAGIDPFTNVDSLLVAGDIGKEQIVAVVKGSFDAAKVSEAIKKEMKADDEGAVEVVGSTLIVGTKAAVASAKEGKGLGGSPAIKDLWSLASTSGTIYGAGLVPAEMLKGFAALSPSVGKIKGIAGSADFSAGFDMKMVTRFADAASATAAKKESDTQLPMAKVMATSFGAPADLFNSLKVEAKDADVTVSWKISTDQIKNIIATAGAMMGGGRSVPPAPAPVEVPAPEATPPAP